MICADMFTVVTRHHHARAIHWLVLADRPIPVDFPFGRHCQAHSQGRCNAHHRSRFRRHGPIDLRELVKPLVIKRQLHVAARRGAMTRAVKLAVEQATCLLDDTACRAVRCRRGHRP